MKIRRDFVEHTGNSTDLTLKVLGASVHVHEDFIWAEAKEGWIKIPKNSPDFISLVVSGIPDQGSFLDNTPHNTISIYTPYRMGEAYLRKLGITDFSVYDSINTYPDCYDMFASQYKKNQEE